jgi:methionine-rich copper-binding protein CopC
VFALPFFRRDLPALKGGKYTVIWHVTSVATQKTEGTYRFTVSR